LYLQAALGFADTDLVTDVKGDILRWYNSKTQGNLQIQTQTRELFMEIPLLNKSSNFPQGSISQSAGLSKATNILNTISRLSGTSYEQGTQSVYSGKFQANKIANATAPFEYQIIRVDFFRSIDKYQILGPDPKEGLIQIWVTAPKEGTIGKLDFPKIQYYYKEINTKSDATYPIIPINSAWDEVSKGKGIISNITPKDGSMFEVAPPQRVDKILINSVKLAYLETKLPQEYIQPIYVFEGNYTGVGSSGSITIYYPAIDPAYTAKK
jgi:hypothetical protein